MMFLKKLNDRKFATNLMSFDFVKKLKNQLIVVMIQNNQIFSNFVVSKNKRSFDTKNILWKKIFYQFIERSNHKFFSNMKNFSNAIEFEIIITIITNCCFDIKEKSFFIVSKILQRRKHKITSLSSKFLSYVKMHYLIRNIVIRIDNIDYHNSNSNERCCKIDKCNNHYLVKT